MLNNQMLMERASLLNVTDKHSLVIATTLPELPKKARISAYTCKACHTEFASNSGSEPYCVNCGADDVEQTPENQTPEVPKDDEELMAVQCKNHECSTYNIVHAKWGNVLDGVMHCVTCGTVLAYDNPFNDGKDAPADTRPAEGKKGTPADTRPAEGKSGTPADTRPAKDEDIISEHAGDNEDFEERPWRQQQSADGDMETEEFESGDPDDVDVTLVEPIDGDQSAEEMVEPDSEEAAEDDFGMDAEQEACEDVAMTLSSVVLANKPKAAFGLIQADDRILATLGGVHVATLEKANAGPNAEVFYSKSLSRAIEEMAATQGPKQALAHFGFKHVALKFPQSKTVAALVRKKVQAAAEDFNEKGDSLRADLEQCVAIAAAGLNRNFFSKHENVLRKGFIQALTTAGVRNSERVVAGVFARFGDDYHRTLLALATDLMKKSVDVRNELAEAIQETNPAAAPQQEQQTDDENLEARVEAAVHEENVPNKPVSLATVSSITSLRQVNGGSLFR